MRGGKQLKRYLINVLLVKSFKVGRPEPSDLPKFRLDFDYAFCNTGVDFAGPLYVEDIYGENDQMLRVTYSYLLVPPQGMFILNLHLVWMPVM